MVHRALDCVGGSNTRSHMGGCFMIRALIWERLKSLWNSEHQQNSIGSSRAHYQHSLNVPLKSITFRVILQTNADFHITSLAAVIPQTLICMCLQLLGTMKIHPTVCSLYPGALRPPSTPFLTRSVSHTWSPLLADNSPGCTCLVEGKFQGKSLFSCDSVIFHTGFYVLYFCVYSFLPSPTVNPLMSHQCRNTLEKGFEHHASPSLVETFHV